MDWLQSWLKMGCVCGRESVLIDGVVYNILEHLAEGGFSNVYLVERRKGGAKFVVKRLTCHSIEDELAVQTEIDMHKRLDGHPNLIRLLGFARSGKADILNNNTSVFHLLLPYYPRGSLQDELERRRDSDRPFAEHEALRLFLCICRAVLHMHQAQPKALVHADVKPLNVLLQSDTEAVLIDLGSAAEARVELRTRADAERLEDRAAERTSIAYRAPELFHLGTNTSIDERVDVWSLGCLLHAICYYRSPFDDVFERGDSVALAVQSTNALKLDEDYRFSVEVHNLIKWMLTTDAELRPHLAVIVDRIEAMLHENEENVVV